jgi:hypothetical protein
MVDTFFVELNQQSSAAVYAHDEWWVKKMLEFQYGDSVTVIDVDGKIKLEYAVVDESKRIITRCSIKDAIEGGSVIKIAKSTGENLTALSNAELLAARAFVRRVKPAGVKLTVVSQNTDYARYFITIYYDPLVNLEDLTDDPGIETLVEAAIKDYHKSIDFDGGVDLRKLEDKIQAIPGVVNFVVTSAEARENSGSFITFNRRYETRAGYIQIDPTYPAVSVDNGGTITYIPNI